MSKSPKITRAPAPSRRGRPKGTGSQTVYADLQRRILRLELPPGADLDEQTLVRQFKLSRTPVREALIRLAHEELVELVPNRGARVAHLHFHEVAEIFDALEIGLRVTSRWAAIRCTPDQLATIRGFSRDFATAAANDDFHGMTEANRDYHIAIAEAAGNRHLTRMLASLLSATFRYGYMTLARGDTIVDAFPGGFPEIIQEHEEMIALIVAGDADAADRLAGQHIRLFRGKVLELLNVNPAKETPLDMLDGRQPRAAKTKASPRRS